MESKFMVEFSFSTQILAQAADMEMSNGAIFKVSSCLCKKGGLWLGRGGPIYFNPPP